jgi:hypothetical protein
MLPVRHFCYSHELTSSFCPQEFNPVVNLKLNNRNDEQKQRTSVVLDTRNPIWNPAEIFHFTLPTDPVDLHSVKLILYMSVPGTSHPPHDYTLFDSVLSSISRVNGEGEKHSLGLHALSLDSLTETPTIISLPLTLSNGSVSNAEVSDSLSLPLSLSPPPHPFLPIVQLLL